MTDLPIRDRRHVIAEQAVAALRRVLPKHWIIREQTNDYGIDVEVELAGSHVTGRIFKGQVKGHEGLGWTAGGTNLQQVKRSTLNYWRQMPVPVVLFLVDVNDGTVYWSPATGSTAEATGIRVLKSSMLPEVTAELEWHIVNWIDDRTRRRMIYQLPLLVRRLALCTERVGYDAWLALEDDELHDVSALYEQVVLTRQALGLSFADMLPWALWSARSRRIFQAAEDLYWGVHDEIIAYVTPFAEEAIASAKEQLRKEDATPENAAAKSLADDGHTLWQFSSEFDEESEDFWDAIDRLLEKCGALKFERRQR